jgi:GTP-binding protein
VPDVLQAEFLAEARDLRSLPAVGAPEIAIAGRSNVGKSTLLNRLAGRRALARTSKTPGRTRGIVFFQLVLGAAAAPLKDLRLADFPGYGYAKVARQERDAWQGLIEGYTEARATLALFVVLIDARRGIADEERQLYEWLGTIGVPAQIVFTKVDKLSAAERGKLKLATQATFKTAPGARRAAPLLVSAETGEGVGELWRAIRGAVIAMNAATAAPAAGEGPAPPPAAARDLPSKR